MADPLSIASGVAGLITLADVVIERTYKTIVTCKNAGKDAQRLLREVQSLLGILKSLHSLELQVNNNAVFRTKIPPDQLLHCQTMLEKLRDKLQRGDTNTAASKLEKAWRTLKWPITSSETDEILAQIERHKATFDLTVSMDTLEAMLMATPALDSVADDIAEIKQSLYRIEMTKDRQAMFEFFGTFDSEPNYQQGRKSRQAGTGLWLIESDELKTWLAERNSKLWLYGIPGAGKTVLASAIIDEALHAASSTVGVAFYFCDYKTSKTRELCNILASLAGQLARQDSRCFDLLKKCYNSNDDSLPRHSMPDADELIQLLQKMSCCFKDVMIIVDALDECFEPGDVSETLREVVKVGFSNVKIALLSRDELEIKLHMKDFVHLSITARSSDLRLYVSSEIEERTRKRRLRIRSSELKDEILEQLINRADGMFRWVACQLDYLCELPSDAERRRALHTLPPTLDETYTRIFRRINLLPEANRRLVQRTLHWLIGDTTPRMDYEALCEAISIEDSDEELDPEAVPDVEEILFRCSSLVRLSVDGGAVELAHFTVKEYLCGPALKSDPELVRFHYSKNEAESWKFRTYLTCLNMDELSSLARTDEQLDEKCDTNPFYEVASWNWYRALPEVELQPPEWSLVHRLFSPTKTRHLQAWAQVFVRSTIWFTGPGYRTPTQADLNVALRAGPLHFACMLQWPTLVKWLVDQGCDANEHCPAIGAPLHCAIIQTSILNLTEVSADPNGLIHPKRESARDSQNEIITHLLESGANPNAPFPGSGRLHDFPMTILACLNGVDAMLVRAGAIVDSNTLECISELEEDHSKWLCVNRLLHCVQVETLSERGRHVFAKLGMYAEKINPSTLESLSLSDVGPEVLALQTRTFIVACESDDIDVVERLHEKYKFRLDDMRESEKSTALTPFLCAARAHAARVVAYLMEQGVRPGQRCVLGRNAIHHCLSRTSSDCATLRTLLEAKVDYNSPDSYGHFPVHRCVAYSTAVNLQVLLDYGADLSVLDGDDRSVMHLVAEYDRLEMYKPLRKMMSSAEFAREMLRKNKHGQSPLHIAAANSPAIFHKILDDQARSTVRASDGRNIWHFAARQASQSCITLKTVLSLGVVPIVRSYDGSTVLHDLIAGMPMSWNDGTNSTSSFSTAFDMLCKTDVDITATNDEGQTALHLLCWKLWQWVEWLMEHHRPLLTDGARLFSRTITRLLESGLDPLLPTLKGSTCLNDNILTFLEAEGYYREILDNLLFAIPDEQLLLYRHGGKCLLAWAADRGLDELCRHLIQRGANPDERGEVAVDETSSAKALHTPLETLCWNGCKQTTFRCALERTQRLAERDRDGLSLLHLASRAVKNGPAMIDELLEFGMEVDCRGTGRCEGETALMVAAAAKNPASVQALLEKGADANALNNISWYALAYACRSGCLESTRLLVEVTAITHGVPSDLGNGFSVRTCPLGIAASNGDIKLLEELLRCKKTASDTNVSALWMACWGGRLEAVKILITHGYDLAATDGNIGTTPLHVAAHSGTLEVVEYLLEVGCSIDVQDKYGRTPVFYAIQGGHLEVVEKLKAHVIDGASPALERQMGSDCSSGDRLKTLRKATYRVSEKSVLDMIQRGDVNEIHLFRESGWNVDSAIDCGKCTPLIVAILKEQHAICQYLLNHGASLEVYGCHEHQAEVTPGHLACRRSEATSILQAILSNPRCPKMHATAHVSSTELGTFLHEAARYGNPRAISLLLDHGADANAQNMYLKTPLHLAAQHGSVEAVRLLLRAGASARTYDDSVRTPSDLALTDGKDHVFEILYESEDAPSSNSGCRASQIFTAAYLGDVGVVRYLISKGESLYDRDVLGYCALTRLLDASNAAAAFALNSGVNFGSADILWPTLPEHDPGVKFRYRKVLMRYDRDKVAVDINARQTPDRPGRPVTPLVMASARGDAYAVGQLITHGALINLDGAPEGTPLMAACTYGRLPIVKILVSLGAVLTYSKNRTVFSAARAAQHFPSIMRWLLVDRFCEQRLLPSCSASALADAYPSIEVQKLNLDLVFVEDWEDYVNSKLRQPSTRKFICRLDGDAGFIEEIPS